MSHPVNDMIADDIRMTVDAMDDKDVIMALSGANVTKVAKFDGSTHDCNIVDFARDILIDQLFDDIFDIVDCDFIPKPLMEPYKKLVKKHKIDPKLCVLVEDIARNLKPAYEMGMKTVWIENNEPWASKFANSSFVNYRTNNLPEFLKKINLLKAA